MPWTSEHLQWLIDTGMTIKTADGKTVYIFELAPQEDTAVFSAWSKHFRNHYCLDTEIDGLRDGTGLTRRDYLLDIKFPDQNAAPGPSVRAGDFSEILLADFMEHLLEFWVPRIWRYGDKTTRNESTKGSDILGFRMVGKVKSAKDILMICEAKAKLTGSTPGNRLQDAVDASLKDPLRQAESLNALKQRLIRGRDSAGADTVKRFQNPADHPYTEEYCAAAVVVNSVFASQQFSETVVQQHPHAEDLLLVVIKGDDLMRLAHKLYEGAADEA